MRFGFLRRGAAVVVRAGWGGSLGERGCGPVVFPPGLVLFLQLDTPVDDIGTGALVLVTVRDRWCSWRAWVLRGECILYLVYLLVFRYGFVVRLFGQVFFERHGLQDTVVPLQC